MSRLKPFLKLLLILLIQPAALGLQDDQSWPPLSYLRNDYKAVSVVAHVRIQQAEITGRIGGYENWKVNAVVLESFKGSVKNNQVIEYFHGAEAGLRREYFDGEKIVFLLGERDPKQKDVRYSVLENSTLQSAPDRLSKLRIIRREFVNKSRRSRKN